MSRIPLLRSGFILALVLVGSGCASQGTNPRTLAAELQVNQRGEIAQTGLVAMDLVVSCAEIQRALDEFPDMIQIGRRVGIVVEPVKNDTRFALDMAAFNAALLGQLAYHTAANRLFLAERASPAGGADYFLSGKLQNLRPLTPEAPATLLFSYQLIDARNSEVVLAGTAELKGRGFVPRVEHL